MAIFHGFVISTIAVSSTFRFWSGSVYKTSATLPSNPWSQTPHWCLQTTTHSIAFFSRLTADSGDVCNHLQGADKMNRRPSKRYTVRRQLKATGSTPLSPRKNPSQQHSVVASACVHWHCTVQRHKTSSLACQSRSRHSRISPGRGSSALLPLVTPCLEGSSQRPRSASRTAASALETALAPTAARPGKGQAAEPSFSAD